MFFMNDKALQELDKANGFEVGVGPSVVVMDEGMAKNVTTTTMKADLTRRIVDTSPCKGIRWTTSRRFSAFIRHEGRHNGEQARRSDARRGGQPRCACRIGDAAIYQ
jgi:hypothetical protein